MWVRNAWYVAAWKDELAPEAVIARTIINQPLVLYRTENRDVVAMEDRCCHRLAPLSKGRREGDDLRCMYHGLKFAPDGRCIEIPGQPTVPASARVRTYPARESGSWIWIWMGEAERADPTLIPGSIAESDAAWHIDKGFLDYDAHYQLINDNLLDLSHLSYVHANTLGRGSPQWADERPRITRLPRGLRFERWIQNYRASNYLRLDGQYFDFLSAYDFLVPGIFIQRVYWYPLGTAEACNRGTPTTPPIFVRCDDQAVTAVTDRTSRYFYATGARSSDIPPALAQDMLRFTERAFREDKSIIEAQQKVIDLEPDRPMLGLSFDAGPNRFRALVRQMIAEETRAAAQAAE